MKKIFLLLFATLFIVAWDQGYDQWVQRQNIPPGIESLFKEKGLLEAYDFYFQKNPFYLRGDFNGDGQPDIAVLVQQKSTKVPYVSIIHQGSKKIFVTSYSGSDIWYVYGMKKVGQNVFGATPPLLKGEAIWIEKSESASGLIYWNGKKYDWGD